MKLVSRLVWMVLLLVAGSVQAAPQGTLVIIGGALRSDNAPVWERIVQLAGGKGARIAVFASAAGRPQQAGESNAQRLRSYGADAFVVPIAVKLAGTDYAALADDPTLAAQVRSAGGAYFAGGDQGRITKALRRPDGSNTLVLDALWDMYRRGGVIAGTSAGAAVMSSTMFNDAKTVLATLKLGVNDGREIAPGLGFIGNDVFVDQHLLIRGRFARMLPAMLKKGYKLGIGIDENSALVVNARRDMEVIGYKGCIVLDLSSARSEPGKFNISGVQISYLDSGDRYQLGTGAFTPSADKVNGRVDAASPGNRGEIFYADILGNTTVVDLMSRLIDSDQVDAIGLAFGRDKDGEADLGFEFRFSRTKDSAGFASATSSAYSIHRLRLDVRPVKMRWPIYQ
ncbi:MAG: cyanophycinase [Pseudomonadota bacterium]